MDDVDLEIEKIEKELKNAKKLASEFKESIRKASSVKLSDTKNKKYVVELKKSLKKMLDYKFNQSNNSSDEALRFKNELFFYIDTLTDDVIYEYLPLFDKVTFNNIKEERLILDKIDLPIYINKLTGDLVITKDKALEITLYSSIANDDIKVSFDYFDNNYISLKEFISKGKYVGDKIIKFKNDKGEVLDINFPYQEFLYYYDNLILTFEHREGERDNFYFYPEANLEIASNFNLSFEGSKLEPVAGLFKNQEYIYETILTNVKRKLESHNEVSDSKKR